MKKRDFFGSEDNDIDECTDHIEIYGSHIVEFKYQDKYLEKMAPYLEDSFASAISLKDGTIYKWTIKKHNFAYFFLEEINFILNGSIIYS